MKKLIWNTFLIAISCVFVNEVKGQTDVKLLDLSIISNIREVGASSDSVELMVMFKINNASQALKTHFWLGSAKDNSSLLIANPVFNTTAGKTYIVFNNISKEVKNYSAVFYVKVSNATYINYAAATLFVEKLNGQMTSRLYYTK